MGTLEVKNILALTRQRYTAEEASNNIFRPTKPYNYFARLYWFPFKNYLLRSRYLQFLVFFGLPMFSLGFMKWVHKKLLNRDSNRAEYFMLVRKNFRKNPYRIPDIDDRTTEALPVKK